MGRDRTAENVFAMCFFMEAGLEVIEKALGKARQDGDYSSEVVADILLSASVLDFKGILRRLESEDSAVREVFWNRVRYQSISLANLDEQTFLSVVSQLLKARRSLSAMELIWRRPVSPELAIQTLKQLTGDIVEQTEPDVKFDELILARLFEQLDENPDVPDQEIAGLEFLFLEALRWHRPELALYRQIMQVPSLFADLISLVFRRSDGQEEPAMPGWTREERFKTFYGILYNLRGFPGLSEDGTVDEEELRAWVSEARQLCADRDRKDSGDWQIGQVLSRAPEGTDGIWPCEPVRELLETLPSNGRVADGFVIGKIAQRGVTARGAFDGGTQERSQLDIYRKNAQAITATWPVTAALLRRIGGGFEARAVQEDATALWRDDSGA